MTMVYIIHEGKVLLLQRSLTKKILPGVWLGIGGKIEPGETIEGSVRREVQEETGLICERIQFRGALSYVRETEEAGMVYLYTVDKFSGTLIEDCDEGTLAWHPIDTITELENFAPHQKAFAPKILKDSTYFYTGISYYEGFTEIGYQDSESFFQERVA